MSIHLIPFGALVYLCNWEFSEGDPYHDVSLGIQYTLIHGY